MWLEVHGRKKWHYYYEPSRVEKQRQFFDHFLKQKADSGVGTWPRVLLEVRERAHVGTFQELDLARSRPEQPFHPHAREERLRPGEPVAVEIEIWPSATLFRAGQQLRVVVQGSDIADRGVPNAPFARHEQTHNQGVHIIHTGGPYDSHLLVPVIPAREPG